MLLDTLDLGVVILVVLQLVQTVKDATHHQQVLILAEQQELQLLQLIQIVSLLLVVFFDHFDVGRQFLSREGVILEDCVQDVFLLQAVHQLSALGVEGLEYDLEVVDFGLNIRILAFLAQREVSLEFGPTQIEHAFAASLDLLPGLEFLPWREEDLHF